MTLRPLALRLLPTACFLAGAGSLWLAATPSSLGSAVDRLQLHGVGVEASGADPAAQVAGRRSRARSAHPGAGAARRYGLLGALFAALLGIGAVGVALTRRAVDELTRIGRRYGALLQPARVPPAGPMVDLSTFEDLAVIAETDERVILQLSDAAGTTFYVDDDGTVYRYRVAARGPLPGGVYGFNRG